MGFREKLEEHWLGIVVVTASISIAGTWVVLNQVLVRPRDEEISRLKDRIGEEKPGQAAVPPVGTSPEPILPRIAEANNQSEKAERPEKELQSQVLSAKWPPFPLQFDSIRPGMPISDAKRLYPTGELVTGGYSVDVALEQSELFSGIYFGFSGSSPDPIIDLVAFVFVDEKSRKTVTSAALSEFGELHHESHLLGAKLVWPKIDGYRLEITDNYVIWPQ